jgi:pantoate--beta-alanine ligase
VLHLESPSEVREECDRQRLQGRRIGLVPTMGYLHQGHLALVRRARQLADFVVVSIFVNPAQFGPTEDLDRYPRDMPADLAQCRAEGADLVFTPGRDQVYPPGYQTYVEVEQVSQGLCGARRPGHFRGVATVVAKLFNMVGPCVAVFGEKDYQQLQVIRCMARDLNQPVEVVGHPIVREPDGLAMSSRNVFLAPAERQAATCLYRALQAVTEAAHARGHLSHEEAVRLARSVIEVEPETAIDYVEVRDAATLEPAAEVGQGRAVLALAVFVGRTRLIDNLVM